jgi:hypothetical protein
MPLVTGYGNPKRQTGLTKPQEKWLGWAVLCLCTAAAGLAQIPQPAPGLAPAGQNSDATPSAIPNSVPPLHTSAAAPGEQTPQSQFPTDAATQPAKVTVDDGKFTVVADNSDLTQILNQVASLSGIAIKGMNGGPRVFGVYGPGNAREILTALLNGSGYNFIMIGGAGDGPPRELLLTLRAGNASPAAKPQTAADPDLDGDDDPDQSDNLTVPPPPPPPPLAPASTAKPAASKEDEDVERTLERMKVIHDHQQDPPQ